MPHWMFQKVVMRNKFLSWRGLTICYWVEAMYLHCTVEAHPHCAYASTLWICIHTLWVRVGSVEIRGVNFTIIPPPP